MTEKKNLELWNSISEADPELCKRVKIQGGREVVTVPAQTCLKKATEMWGPMGGKWGLSEVKRHFVEVTSLDDTGETHETVCLYSAVLYYPDEAGETNTLPVEADISLTFHGKSYTRYNSDWSKMVATEAMKKGLSKLGMNSDIYEGMWDDDQYVRQAMEKTDSVSAKARAAQKKLRDLVSENDIPVEVIEEKIHELGKTASKELTVTECKKLASWIKKKLKEKGEE